VWAVHLVYDVPDGVGIYGGLLVRIKRRNPQRSRLDCGLRIIDGHQEGLGDKWTHGSGQVSPGHLRFQRMYGGIRFLKAPPISITVLEVAPGVDQTKLREAWSVRPGTVMVELITPSARLIWGIPPGSLTWAMEQLNPNGNQGSAAGNRSR
jgi:hypothetical protein